MRSADADTTVLEDAEELTLWEALKGRNDADARHALFSRHTDFARRIARKHWLDRRSGAIELADLQQLAFAGLLEAIDRFDPVHGVPFRGFAERRISGSVLDGLSKMSEIREQLSFRNRVRKERAQSLTPANAQDLTTSEAIDALVEAAVGLALGFMLEGFGGQDAQAGADRPKDAYESLAWKETIHRLFSEIVHLPRREQFVIRHHYLEGVAFEQIGQLMNLSKGRVSQIHRAGLDLLRRRLHPDRFNLER